MKPERMKRSHPLENMLLLLLLLVLLLLCHPFCLVLSNAACQSGVLALPAADLPAPTIDASPDWL
jgi:hypothetical protein